MHSPVAQSARPPQQQVAHLPEQLVLRLVLHHLEQQWQLKFVMSRRRGHRWPVPMHHQRVLGVQSSSSTAGRRNIGGGAQSDPTAECSSLLSVLTLCILLSILTVGFLLVVLVCFRAIFGDILEDEIASLPRRSVYRAWGSCSAATSAWQGGKARNAEPFARKTNYR